MQVCMIHTSICQKDRLNTGMFSKLDQNKFVRELDSYSIFEMQWIEIEQLKCFISWGFGIL